MCNTRHTLSVCVVTVTYGDRCHLLREVVNAVMALNGQACVKRLIIVANGASHRTNEYLGQIVREESRVAIISLPKNMGSASGFARGMRAAVDVATEYIWLLDDDNRPEPDSLEKLVETIATHRHSVACMALRPDKTEYAKYAEGMPAELCLSGKNSFLGYSAVNWARRLSRLFRGKGDSNPVIDPIERDLVLPYALYGGLLFPTWLIARIGFPREDFVLYSDDHEFTLRFSSANVPILLVPDSIVIDIDRSWNMMLNKRADTHFVFPLVPLHKGNDVQRRLYYSIRNRFYIERRILKYSGVLYAINGTVVLTAVAALSLIGAMIHHSIVPFKSLWTICLGLHDGLLARLGPGRFSLEG